MKPLICLLVLGTILGATGAVPDGFIHLNASVKFIVNPSTGSVPATTNDANFRQVFDLMNRWLANTNRGYRVRLVDLDANSNFKRIGGLNDTTGPSKYYNTDLKGGDVTSDAANIEFENAAVANSALYGWSATAMNIYVNNGGWSSARFPASGRGLVITGYGLIANNAAPEFYLTNNYKIAGNLLHELGHYFALPHTWDETFADFAPDLIEGGGRNEAVVRNAIAAHAYGAGQTYAALLTTQKQLVDNTANNAMSYYQLFYDDPAQSKVLTDAERFGPTRFVFTELQMDRVSDNANVQRGFAASGDTRFVDASAGVTQSGTSAQPYKTLASGVTAASASGLDIVLLRPGTYTASILSKPLTIRATRTGPVIIQKP